jgi:ATP-dependent 26S proteasome regulatory subunit
MASPNESDPIAWLAYGRSLIDSLGPGERDPIDRGDLDDRFAASLAEPGAFQTLLANIEAELDTAQVLAVLLAVEVDPSLHHQVAAAQRDPSRNRLTLGSIVQLFAESVDSRGALTVAPESILRRSAMVNVVEEGPWSDHVIAVHPSVVWALLGDDSADPDLPAIRARIGSESADGSMFTVVSGRDRVRRWQAAAGSTLGSKFLVVDAPPDDAAWAALVREATLTGLSIVVEVESSLPIIGQRWIVRAAHIPWSVTGALELGLDDLPDRPWRSVLASDDGVSPEEWEAALGEDAAHVHRLTPDQLDRVARVYDAVERDLDRAVRRLAGGRLETLARRIRPSRGWNDIVLSADRKDQLRSIVERYQFADTVYGDWGFSATPSRGIVALFSGPSGTGKTLAAEVIANQLGLDVFKLDLSAVVSKYIGETEKNLEQVFDAAGAGNMVLFFDEADALFGKRSEVKDARDRYANIEVSYLLQRLEAYDGLVIMATNFEKNVDEAFLRRIHNRIEFTLPGPDERSSIWEQNFPATAPLGDIDLEWLSSMFEISGGAIRNASVHAAFIAATRGTAITTESAVLGVAREYRKLGRLIKADDFGAYFDAVVEFHAGS